MCESQAIKKIVAYFLNCNKGILVILKKIISCNILNYKSWMSGIDLDMCTNLMKFCDEEKCMK